jgi:hypothetical protein
MRRHLERWRGLAPRERRLLLQLTLLLPLIGLALNLLGYRRTHDALGRAIPQRTSAPRRAPAESPAEIARLIARLVSIAARHGPYRASCLRQSLALWWLLRRRGIAADLRIGVRREQNRVEAHAWVEYNDEALSDAGSTSGTYEAFDTPLPARFPSGP